MNVEDDRMAVHATGHVGKWDRAVRAILGLVLLGFALFCPFAEAQGAFVVWASGVIGAVLAVTAATGRCPLYRLIGVRT
jgi:hypothetical protein